MISAFTADEATLPALKDNAIGVYGVLTWAPNMDNPANKKFVSDYEAAYKAVPASYAMQAYDTAMLIDSAAGAVKGNVRRQSAERGAASKAALPRCAGRSSSTINGYPIEDFYLTKVVKRADGNYADTDRREDLLELRRRLRQGLQDPVARFSADLFLPDHRKGLAFSNENALGLKIIGL